MSKKTKDSIKISREALEQLGNGMSLIGVGFAKHAGEIFAKSFAKFQIAAKRTKNHK